MSKNKIKKYLKPINTWLNQKRYIFAVPGSLLIKIQWSLDRLMQIVDPFYSLLNWK